MFSFSRAALFQKNKHLGGFLKHEIHWWTVMQTWGFPGCCGEGTPCWRPQFSLGVSQGANWGHQVLNIATEFFIFILFFKDDLFIFRERGKEGEREGEKH